MIFAKLNSDGMLSNIRFGSQQPGGVWPDGSQDVSLISMPIGYGPFGYDSINQIAVPFFPAVQQQKINDLIQQSEIFVSQFYSANTSILINSLYSQAIHKGLINRASYLEPLIDWGNEIASTLETAIEQITSSTTIDQVQSISISFLPPPKPFPTRSGAMAITN